MLLEPRTVKLSTRTGIEVHRTIPHGRRRTIGAWCFVDHFGPTVQTDGMVVAAHPHIGLQTVTWLFEGQVEHRDSVGSVQLIRAGEVNVMTSGRGIAHSELSLADSELLHAVQLWVALPDSERNRSAHFEHRGDLPTVELNAHGATAKVFIGELAGAAAATQVFSPLLGAELRIPAGQSVTLSMTPNWDYGVLVVDGRATVNGEYVDTRELVALEPDATQITIEAGADADLLAVLLGGEPLGEPLLMWWNFVAREHNEIVEARELWNSEGPARSARFGADFEDQIGGWIPAPELPNLILQARY